MNTNMRVDRIGALFVSTQTGKSMDKYMPWSKDPGVNKDSSLSSGIVSAAKIMPEGSVVDGITISHSRKVSSKPDPASLKKQPSRTVSPLPKSKKSTIITLEQRRERLKKHGK